MSELYADTVPVTPLPEEDLLTRLIRQAETQGKGVSQSDLPSAAEARTSEGDQSATGGLLNGLLSNPALLSALPQLLNGLGGLSKGSAARPIEAQPMAATPTDARSAETQPAPEGGGTPLTSIKIPHLDRHTALLCAIKPYLGSSRRQAAEYLINLCRMWDTLQGMGLNLPALLLPPRERVEDPPDKEV